MILIWYNPDVDRYEVGLKKDFKARTIESRNRDRFLVLYEFEHADPSCGLAPKIISNLNQARAIAPKRREIFA